jgi:stage V sporulation protein AC
MNKNRKNVNNKNMNITKEEYAKMAKKASPKSKALTDTMLAFLIGGGICTIGELILEGFKHLGFSLMASAAWTSIILIGVSATLTGLGLFRNIAKHSGAGTLVPITGFANAVASSAIEAKSEGYILGVGAKIFTIAGPVIAYGTLASVIYGLVYYFIH